MYYIFIVHRGDSYYLPLCLAQARVSNPTAKILLLGDEANSGNIDFYKKFNIEHVAIEEYSKSSDLFQEVYIHDSPNNFSYECFCFQRWMIINEYVEHKAINGNFCCLDSDALLYIDIKDIFNEMESGFAVCDEVGPQYLMFKDAKILERYCKFIVDCFTNDVESRYLRGYIAQNRHILPVHINDMATLGAFAKNTQHLDLGMKSVCNIFFDENVSFSQGLKMTIFGKRVYRVDGQLYFKRNTGELIRAGGIHAQGSSKQFMPVYLDRSIALNLITIKVLHHFIMGLGRLFRTLIKSAIKRSIKCGF